MTSDVFSHLVCVVYGMCSPFHKPGHATPANWVQLAACHKSLITYLFISGTS